MKLLLITLLMALAPATAPSDANSLADAVMKASGSDVWPRVSRLKFTFNVQREGQPPTLAKHDWDIRAGTDTVSWDGKTVTINIANAGDSADAKAAFKRWTNDTYWLLMPLKLKDGGVMLVRAEPVEIDGKTYDVLHMKFGNVGLTPGDQYNLYIDPETHLVRWWDYMPSSQAKSRMSWRGYQQFNGLTLATEHDLGDGGRITMTEIEVTTD